MPNRIRHRPLRKLIAALRDEPSAKIYADFDDLPQASLVITDPRTQKTRSYAPTVFAECNGAFVLKYSRGSGYHDRPQRARHAGTVKHRGPTARDERRSR